MSEFSFPWERMKRTYSVERRTPLIYYGGKSRDADWIIRQFPPHTTFVDVFGGGGAISFRKRPSAVDVYNDIGNVANFFEVLRNFPDELYRALYFTPFSRQEFDIASKTWQDEMRAGNKLEWARKWYIVINQGYTHEESSDTWHVAKQVNSAVALANHTDDLPNIVDRLRRMHIEHYSFEKLIPLYDLPSTLFYCDPPYLSETRASHDNYHHEMPYEKHVELLNMIKQVKGQVVLSGYDSQLYNASLKDWRRVTKTAKSSIQNSKSIETRGDRTEVLWIKEHHSGFDFWSEETPADVAGIRI